MGSADASNGSPQRTRWSFQDFKVAYDNRFGRKVCPTNETSDSKPVLSQSTTDRSMTQNGRVNGDANYRPKTGGTAIYEQFLSKPPGLQGSNDVEQAGIISSRVMRPLLDFTTMEMRELAETITRDIVRGDPDVRWDSIKGLENAKRLLKEAVIMPIKYPQYFTGLLSPWKGILLFGPPGTGKTMLAKAVATECNTTFFNISASSIVSKWRGDSEKLVRVLFELARHHAPSTIFLDEIDSIMGQRGESRSEHEASRRLKTELLVQMDGLMKTTDLVFLLAATNLPWELDAAALRRLEKRILVPLPNDEARLAMFDELLSKPGLDLPFDQVVAATQGYSGSDIRILCKEAAMRPLRRLMGLLDKIDPSSEEELPEMGPVTLDDVLIALKTTRPSAHMQAERYDKFDHDFGSQAV